MQGFTDKAILVTGSTRGIGHAIAAQLLAAGATVGIHGRNRTKVESICTELSGNTIPVAADFSDPAEAAAAVQSFVKSAGHIAGLVNNAGGGKAIAFRGLTLEKWNATLAVNLDAAMSASRDAYIHMRKAGSGNIVNIASLAAHGPGRWMGADYAASKAGLVILTKSLAFEAARFDIRVNAVSPGFVETDMTTVLPQETRDALNIPLGRLAHPDEIANVVLFLLSDHSSYITGQVLHVNGGLWMG